MPDTAVTEPAIAFEVDRAEVVGENRLEVTGRWYGVRGRRFVRPTLTLIGAGERARCLAELDDKPWAAADGEAWRATFTVEPLAEDVTEMELAVTPDIAVILDPPARLPRAPGPSRARHSARPAAQPPPPEPEPALPTPDPVREREVAALVDAANRARRTAGEERDTLVAERDALVAERDALAAERDTAAAERDAAITARDSATADRDAAQLATQTARADARAATDALAALRAELDRALAERAELERAIAERDESQRASTRPPRIHTTAHTLIQKPAAQPSANRLLVQRLVALAIILAAMVALLIILQSS